MSVDGHGKLDIKGLMSIDARYAEIDESHTFAQRLRQIGKDTGMQHLLVLILSSKSVQRVQEYPIIETELFARMDAAVVDLTASRILLTAAGEEDYILAQRRDVVKTIGYPRIYYRTQTTTGPFTVVERDPFAELGKIAFTAATDQVLLALQAD